MIEMTTIKKGEKLICPLCDKKGDGDVEDYVVSGSPDNIPHHDQCGWCDAALTITPFKNGTEFRVEAEESDED
jgi:hypothetical protein